MNEDVFVDSDDFGFETGTTDGSGLVDMGDGLYVPTKDFKTIRLPEEHGGQWATVLGSGDTIIEGMHGTLYLLSGEISVFSARDMQLWIPTHQIEHYFTEGEE
mgnify:FL=1